jgi:hypothetical protein
MMRFDPDYFHKEQWDPYQVSRRAMVGNLANPSRQINRYQERPIGHDLVGV